MFHCFIHLNNISKKRTREKLSTLARITNISLDFTVCQLFSYICAKLIILTLSTVLLLFRPSDNMKMFRNAWNTNFLPLPSALWKCGIENRKQKGLGFSDFKELCLAFSGAFVGMLIKNVFNEMLNVSSAWVRAASKALQSCISIAKLFFRGCC